MTAARLVSRIGRSVVLLAGLAAVGLLLRRSGLGDGIRAAAAHGPDLARVLSVASFLVDGVRTGRDGALDDGVTVEVLPPFAGGSR